KRATQFNQCDVNLPPLDVFTSPDPIVSDQDNTFSISGTATSDITEATVGIYVYGNNYFRDYKDDFCKLYESCPVKNNTKFDFQFTVKPDNLPADYIILVGLFDTEVITYCADTMPSSK
ncbi:2569_t:CDS:1, partial [Paraglomus occultum]